MTGQRLDRRRERISDPLARLLLLLYPRHLRRRFGAEIWFLHRRLHRRQGRARLYLRFAADALRNGPAARFEGEPRSSRHLPQGRSGPAIVSLADGLGRDLRHAVRALSRRPGLALTVVLTLAIALGANVALFAVLDAELLRPLGYREPDRLVQLLGVDAGSGAQHGTIAYLDFVDWVRRTDVFTSASAYDEWQPNLTTGGRPERLSAALVNATYFDVLGVQPAAGRFFAPNEEVDGHDRVVVLSYRFWQRRFAGDPAVVSRDVELDGRLHEVIGVAPEGFVDPRLSGDGFGAVELWRPLGYEGVAAERLPSRSSESYTAIGRLAPGVTRREAEERLNAVADDLAHEFPDTNPGRSVRLLPLEEHLVGRVSGTLGLLMGAVGFVLLIAIANVANLLLGRLAERRREVAVRAALGAGRGALLRALVSEALVLACLGGGLGTGAAWLLIQLMASRAGALLPRALPLHPSLGVLLFAAGLTVVTGVVCGLAPALLVRHEDLRASLHTERSAGSPRHSRLRTALAVGEVTVSVVLLVGAALLLQSFWNLSGVDPGIDTRGVLTFQLSPPSSDYPDRESVEAFYDRLLNRLRALPGVEDVASTNLVPLSGGFDGNSVSAAERPAPPPGEALSAETRTVTPSYFRTLGLRLLAGRELSDTDRAGIPPVTVISKALAEALWPGESAVGRRVRAFGATLAVVGVVDDVKHLALDQPAPPRLFMTRAQSLAPWQGRRSTVLIRTQGDPLAVLPAARQAVWSLDDSLPLSAEQPLQRLVGESIAAERLRGLLVAGFASLAAVLAALGLYGVLAYLVVQRRLEIAVRMALGSERRAVVGLVVRQGMGLVLAGVAVGSAVAAALARSVSAFLFEISPTDPRVFTVVAALMLGVGALACWIPALRSAVVDPARALREG